MHKKKIILVLTTIFIVGSIGIVSFLYLEDMRNQEYHSNQRPSLKYPYNNSLKVDVFAEGLSFPTSMEFVDDKDLLVLEKNKGTVRHILTLTNTSIKDEPVLKLYVDPKGEQGLLGIAAMDDDNEGEGNSSLPATVFLYYTHGIPTLNSIIKYEWNGQKLVNPELILDLPAEPGPYHQGGKLKVEIEKNKGVFLYAVIGDLTSPDTVLQNNKYGKEPNNTSVILRINLRKNNTNLSSVFQYHNEVISNNIPDSHNYNKSNIGSRNNESNGIENYSNNYQYSSFAYGVRNSYGLAVDPITGNLWDTENGEDEYDEINLVRPGFNSGWMQVMGPMSRNLNKTHEDLVRFPGSHYSDPVFSWKNPIGITDIEFLNTTKLGSEYADNVIVGDINNGNLYYFKVNSSRTGIAIPDRPGLDNEGLIDLVADDNKESSLITIGTNFGRITDIDIGPDGLLYILSYEQGKIFRISSMK